MSFLSKSPMVGISAVSTFIPQPEYISLGWHCQVGVFAENVFTQMLVYSCQDLQPRRSTHPLSLGLAAPWGVWTCFSQDLHTSPHLPAPGPGSARALSALPPGSAAWTGLPSESVFFIWGLKSGIFKILPLGLWLVLKIAIYKEENLSQNAQLKTVGC